MKGLKENDCREAIQYIEAQQRNYDREHDLVLTAMEKIREQAKTIAILKGENN